MCLYNALLGDPQRPFPTEPEFRASRLAAPRAAPTSNAINMSRNTANSSVRVVYSNIVFYNFRYGLLQLVHVWRRLWSHQQLLLKHGDLQALALGSVFLFYLSFV